MRRWESATLAWLRGTPVEDACADMRFCPVCLRMGYHTVVFQLASVTTCPLHGVPLVQGCTEVGFAQSPDLNLAALASPFACPQCGHPLAPGEVLVNPPPVDGQPVSRIFTWYRRLSTLPVVAPEPITSGIGPPAFAPSWRQACLAIVDGHPVPTSVAIERKDVCAKQAVRARCGIHLTEQEAWSARDSMGNSQRRHTLIYKAYRRHVQKALPYRNPQIMLALVDGAADLWCPTSAVEEQNRRAAAWALLLFRSRMESWPDIFTYGNPVLGRRHLDGPFSSRALSSPRFQTRTCHPLSAEGRWLLDHLYGEELRATFAEAVSWAESMATSGWYRQSQELSWGLNLPYSVGVRHKGCMEFRSWRRSIRHDKESCEI